MNQIEIENYLLTDKTTAQYFRGVVSYDELCECGGKTGYYVVNLDESSGPGTHWICLYLYR